MPQVNALDGQGQTALHRVAQQGNMQACRLLLQYGVDPSTTSLQGYLAAQLAPENIQKLLRGEALEAASIGDTCIVDEVISYSLLFILL